MLKSTLLTAIFKLFSSNYFTLDKNLNIIPPENTTKRKHILYMHIPFCKVLCPYCSFNRYTYEPALAKKYFSALRKELKMYHDHGYRFSSIYIGGGTPTIAPAELEKTISLVKDLSPIKEISLETNPSFISGNNIKFLKKLEVNYLSIGVQTFNNDLLKKIDRFEKYGSGDDIRKKLEMTHDHFDTVNVDMMFNYPFQTLEILKQDLALLKNLHPRQVTYYPLMTSKNQIRELSLEWQKFNYKFEKTFYYTILDSLSEFLIPSTVWCFTKNNKMIDEYIINNDDYAGVGSGAFSYLNGSVLVNTFSPKEYIQRINQNEFPILFKKDYSVKEQQRYDFLMKLFGRNLNLKELDKKYNTNFEKSFWKEITFFKLLGSIKKKKNTFHLTRDGMYNWLVLMREFFKSVNQFRYQCRKAITDQ